MYREFRKLLGSAKGVSQQIIAINLDIRGFTPFCEGKDSFDVAAYITKVYMKIIEGYFSDATFYKPTGDGLLIAIVCGKKMKATVNKTIESCLKLLEDFGSLCEGEDLVYFPTPDKIGIGIARGSVCCIASGNKILDYSGKVLNLASRFMDIARPSGIVFDTSLGFKLLSKEKRELFEKEDQVYVRGIAEEQPISAYYTKKHTIIPAVCKQPIKGSKWESLTEVYSLRKLIDCLTYGSRIVFYLPSKPLNQDRILIKVQASTGIMRYREDFDMTDRLVEYKIRGKEYEVSLKLKPVVKLLKSKGVKENTPIKFMVSYPVK